MRNCDSSSAPPKRANDATTRRIASRGQYCSPLKIECRCLFRLRANLPRMFGANVCSELAVALAFVPKLHFLYRVTDQRTRCGKPPPASRAAVAAKRCVRDPYDSPSHDAMYTKPCGRGNAGRCASMSRNEKEKET